MSDEETPERRLSRYVARLRRKAALAIAAAVLVTAGAAFVFLQKPEVIGVERVTVITSALAQGESVGAIRLNIEFPDGRRRSLRVRAILGLKPGDTFCVARLRTPVLGREQLMHLPDRRCEDASSPD